MTNMIANTIIFALAVGLVSTRHHYGHHELKNEATGQTDQERKGLEIYNGNSTSINAHKYLVGILKNENFICSGSIISETWILTVGDCTNGLTIDEVKVVGSSSDGVTGKTFSTLQIVQHPDYGTNKLDYEFSCVQISGKFYYWAKRVLLLPTAAPADNTVLQVAGYGYTDSSSSERALMEADMTWLPTSTCESSYKNFDFSWTDRMACADNADGATLCKGDYGDALVVGRVMYGMFAGGSTSGFCTSSAKPVIVANIFAVASWIQNVTGASYTN